jgi:hypothetical protein
MKTNIQTKRREAGKRGGLATLAKYGKDHFKQIGKRGAAVFHRRYSLSPFGMDDFAVVKRETGEVIAFLSGRPY